MTLGATRKPEQECPDGLISESLTGAQVVRCIKVLSLQRRRAISIVDHVSTIEKSQLLLRLGLLVLSDVEAKVSQLHRPKADGPSLGKIVTSFSIYLPSIQQQVTMRISGFGGRGRLTHLLSLYEGSLTLR